MASEEYERATAALDVAIPPINTANSVNDILLDQIKPRLPASGTISTLAAADVTAAVPPSRLFISGACDAGMTASTTTIVSDDITGYGNDYFNNKWWMQVVKNANSVGNAPEREYRKITDYVSSTGTFTVDAFSANVEASDSVVLVHEGSIGFQTKEWATAGNYTWTVPAGVYLLDELMVVAGGGGGGGGGSGRATDNTAGNFGSHGVAGGSSVFVGITSAGGPAGSRGYPASSGAHAGCTGVGTTYGLYTIPTYTAPTTTVPYNAVFVLSGGLCGTGGGGADTGGVASVGGESFAQGGVVGADTDIGGGGGGGGGSLSPGGAGGAGGAAGAAGSNGSAAIGCGAGGGGGGGGAGATYYGGGARGAGGAAAINIKNYPVFPGTVLSLTVGAPGTGAAGGASSGAGSYAGGNGGNGSVGRVRISWRERSAGI